MNEKYCVWHIESIQETHGIVTTIVQSTKIQFKSYIKTLADSAMRALIGSVSVINGHSNGEWQIIKLGGSNHMHWWKICEPAGWPLWPHHRRQWLLVLLILAELFHTQGSQPAEVAQARTTGATHLCVRPPACWPGSVLLGTVSTPALKCIASTVGRTSAQEEEIWLGTVAFFPLCFRPVFQARPMRATNVNDRRGRKLPSPALNSRGPQSWSAEIFRSFWHSPRRDGYLGADENTWGQIARLCQWAVASWSTRSSSATMLPLTDCKLLDGLLSFILRSPVSLPLFPSFPFLPPSLFFFLFSPSNKHLSEVKCVCCIYCPNCRYDFPPLFSAQFPPTAFYKEFSYFGKFYSIALDLFH